MGRNITIAVNNPFNKKQEIVIYPKIYKRDKPPQCTCKKVKRAKAPQKPKRRRQQCCIGRFFSRCGKKKSPENTKSGETDSKADATNVGSGRKVSDIGQTSSGAIGALPSDKGSQSSSKRDKTTSQKKEASNTTVKGSGAEVTKRSKEEVPTSNRSNTNGSAKGMRSKKRKERNNSSYKDLDSGAENSDGVSDGKMPKSKAKSPKSKNKVSEQPEQENSSVPLKNTFIKSQKVSSFPLFEEMESNKEKETPLFYPGKETPVKTTTPKTKGSKKKKAKGNKPRSSSNGSVIDEPTPSEKDFLDKYELKKHNVSKRKKTKKANKLDSDSKEIIKKHQPSSAKDLLENESKTSESRRKKSPKKNKFGKEEKTGLQIYNEIVRGKDKTDKPRGLKHGLFPTPCVIEGTTTKLKFIDDVKRTPKKAKPTTQSSRDCEIRNFRILKYPFQDKKTKKISKRGSSRGSDALSDTESSDSSTESSRINSLTARSIKSPRYKPKHQQSPKCNHSPSGKQSPKSSLSPRISHSPREKLSPKLNHSPEGNISPKGHQSPKSNLSPRDKQELLSKRPPTETQSKAVPIAKDVPNSPKGKETLKDKEDMPSNPLFMHIESMRRSLEIGTKISKEFKPPTTFEEFSTLKDLIKDALGPSYRHIRGRNWKTYSTEALRADDDTDYALKKFQRAMDTYFETMERTKQAEKESLELSKDRQKTSFNKGDIMKEVTDRDSLKANKEAPPMESRVKAKTIRDGDPKEIKTKRTKDEAVQICSEEVLQTCSETSPKRGILSKKSAMPCPNDESLSASFTMKNLAYKINIFFSKQKPDAKKVTFESIDDEAETGSPKDNEIQRSNKQKGRKVGVLETTEKEYKLQRKSSFMHREDLPQIEGAPESIQWSDSDMDNISSISETVSPPPLLQVPYGGYIQNPWAFPILPDKEHVNEIRHDLMVRWIKQQNKILAEVEEAKAKEAKEKESKRQLPVPPSKRKRHKNRKLPIPACLRKKKGYIQTSSIESTESESTEDLSSSSSTESQSSSSSGTTESTSSSSSEESLHKKSLPKEFVPIECVPAEYVPTEKTKDPEPLEKKKTKSILHAAAKKLSNLFKKRPSKVSEQTKAQVQAKAKFDDDQESEICWTPCGSVFEDDFRYNRVVNWLISQQREIDNLIYEGVFERPLQKTICERIRFWKKY